MTTRPSDWTDDERDAFAGLDDQLDAMSARYRQDPPVDALLAQLAQVEVTDAALDDVAEARLLRRVRAASTPPPRAQWRRSLAIALAAAAVGVVAVRVMQRPAPAPAAAASPVPPPVVDLPAPPGSAYKVPFEKAEVRLSLGALTWRGGGQPSGNGLVEDLKPGIDAYRAGDYAAAGRLLAPLVAQYPDAVEVHFYLGVTELLRDEPAGAVTALERAVDLGDQTFAGDAAWYLAVAHQHAGDLDVARSELQQICDAGAAHGQAACEALARLATPGTPGASKGE
jgi:TolA-binding protein